MEKAMEGQCSAKEAKHSWGSVVNKKNRN